MDNTMQKNFNIKLYIWFRGDVTLNIWYIFSIFKCNISLLFCYCAYILKIGE